MFSFDEQGLELNQFDIDIIGIWSLNNMFQEVENKTSFGRMRVANRILEAALYEIHSIQR